MDQHVGLVVISDKELRKRGVLRAATQITDNSLYSIDESVYIKGLKKAVHEFANLVQRQ